MNTKKKIPYRIGFGYDVHRFAPNRELWLGGVLIPFERGLLGHSDADVLLHAISDAILGAAALRDIGYHFPDTNPQFQGVDSSLLLKEVSRLVGEKGYEIGNIDATIVAERPKINPYVLQMQERIADVLGIDTEQVSIKATTNEKMGYAGREEGIIAYANALIISI